MNQYCRFSMPISLFFCTLACMVMVSCGGPQEFEGQVRNVVIDREALENIAKQIYDEVNKPSGGNTEGIIKDFFESLDMYVELGSEDHIQYLLGSQKPVVFPINVKAMAMGYEKGILVTLESFITAMEEWGAFIRPNTHSPITYAHLTNSFAFLMDADEYTAEEIIPALILFLGHERVKQTPFYIKSDAVWADGYLDPIQFFLLSCAVMMSGPVYSPTASSYSASHINQARTLQDLQSIFEALNLRKLITEQVAKVIGIPLTWEEALQAIIAASVVLNSYELNVTMDESILNKKWLENPGGSTPYESNVTASLSFDFVPHNQFSRELVLFCLGERELPDQGGTPDKPITWTLEGTLPSHSAIEPLEGATSAQGTVQALFKAFDEDVPEMLRKDRDTPAHGNVTARAKNLLPWKWRTIEAIVREVKEVGLDAQFVNVHFYKFPNINVEFDVTVTFDSDDWFVSTRYYASFPLELDKSENVYKSTTRPLYNTFRSDGQAFHKDPDCSLTVPLVQDGDMNLRILLSNDKTDLDMFINAGPLPGKRFHVVCPEGETDTGIPIPLCWAGWILAHEDTFEYGIGGINLVFNRILGPWTKGAGNIIATTDYTVNVEQYTVNTKVKLSRTF